MSLDFCFPMRLFMRPLDALSLWHTRSFSDAFLPRTELQYQPSFLLLPRSFPKFFHASLAVTMRVFCAFSIKCTVSPTPIARLRSIAHIHAHSLRFAHVSALSQFGRSFCTFYYNFVSLFVETVTFRDFDSNISSVCVHIFPRGILAYQVSILLYVRAWKRGISGLALAFCIVFSSCFPSFLVFHDVISR